MNNPYPLVMIEWVDSHRTEGWHSDPVCKTPMPCVSVGFLIYDGKEVKTVAAHLASDDYFENKSSVQRAGEMTIPCCAITKLKYLKGKP